MLLKVQRWQTALFCLSLFFTIFLRKSNNVSSMHIFPYPKLLTCARDCFPKALRRNNSSLVSSLDIVREGVHPVPDAPRSSLWSDCSGNDHIIFERRSGTTAAITVLSSRLINLFRVVYEHASLRPQYYQPVHDITIRLFRDTHMSLIILIRDRRSGSREISIWSDFKQTCTICKKKKIYWALIEMVVNIDN